MSHQRFQTKACFFFIYGSYLYIISKNVHLFLEMIDDRSSDEISIASSAGENIKKSGKKKQQKSVKKMGQKSKKPVKMIQQKKKAKIDSEDDDVTEASENFGSENSETDDEEILKNHLEKKSGKSQTSDKIEKDLKNQKW